MSDTEINNKEIDQENYVNCNLELGDVIEIQAPDNKDFHEQTFYILYIDDQLIDLTNIENESSSTIRLDEDGNIKDESIESITILNRSDEKGFARQQNVLPKTHAKYDFIRFFNTPQNEIFYDIYEKIFPEFDFFGYFENYIRKPDYQYKKIVPELKSSRPTPPPY